MKEYKLTSFDLEAIKRRSYRDVILDPIKWMDDRQKFLTDVYSFDNFEREKTISGGWCFRCFREKKGRLKMKQIYFYLTPID